MRYFIVMFWSVLLGQVVSYIGGALSQGTYDLKMTFLVSIIVGIGICILGEIVIPKEKAAVSAKK